jgi:hypothetical protein
MLETAMMLMESFHGFEQRYDYSIVGHSGDAPEIPFVAFGASPENRKERLKVLQRMIAHTQYCMSGDHTLEGQVFPSRVFRTQNPCVLRTQNPTHRMLQAPSCTTPPMPCLPSYVSGTEVAMRRVVEDDKADDHFVFVLSDANLRRCVLCIPSPHSVDQTSHFVILPVTLCTRYGIEPARLGQIMSSDSRVKCYAIFLGSIGDEAERLSAALPSGKAFTCFDTSKLPAMFKQIFTSSFLM